MESDFYFNITCIFVLSSLIFYIMMKTQEKKQKEADEKFEFTIKMIELRNKKHGDDNA